MFFSGEVYYMKEKIYLILSLLFILLGIGLTTFGIYKLSISGSAEVSTAIWDVVFKDGEDIIEDNFTLVLGENECDDNHVRVGKIAPGVTCSKSILIDASKAEVDVDYKLEIIEEGITPSFMDANKLVASLTEDEGSIYMNDLNRSKLITLTVHWNNNEEDNIDSADTALSGMEITVPVRLVAKQKTHDSIVYTDVDDSESFKTSLKAGKNVRLMSNISLTENLAPTKEAVLDLNGHILDMGTKTLAPYGNLRILDSSLEKNGKLISNGSFVLQIGSSTKTGVTVTFDSGTIEGAGSYGVRNFGNLIINGGKIVGKSFVVYNQGNVTLNDGSIISSDGLAMRLNSDATLVMNGGLIKTNSDSNCINAAQPGAKVTINGGRIEATSIDGAGIGGFKDTEVIINDGEIISNSFALFGNGSTSGSNDGTNAKFTINGGKLTSTDACAIYIPQKDGITNINGGIITGISADEIRAGKLNINGGTLSGDKTEYVLLNNNNGSTTTGSAVAVTQHTTKYDINVNIRGGILNGYLPLSISNPAGNSTSDLEKVHVNVEKVNNLVFNSTGTSTVLGLDSTKFIKGGLYTHSVIDYVVDGYSEIDNNGLIEVVKD